MKSKRTRLRNITLSAQSDLIDSARRRARENKTTLNEAFRTWLEQFTRPIASSSEYELLMTELKGVLSGARFSREDANER